MNRIMIALAVLLAVVISLVGLGGSEQLRTQAYRNSLTDSYVMGAGALHIQAIMRDGDVTQPSNYEYRLPPSEGGAVAVSPSPHDISSGDGDPPGDPPPPAQSEQGTGSDEADETRADGLQAATDGRDGYTLGEWFIPRAAVDGGEDSNPAPEPDPEEGETPDGEPAYSLGYSSASGTGDLERIRQGVDGILYCLTLGIAGIVVYLFCRAVWPLFNYF